GRRPRRPGAAGRPRRLEARGRAAAVPARTQPAPDRRHRPGLRPGRAVLRPRLTTRPPAARGWPQPPKTRIMHKSRSGTDVPPAFSVSGPAWPAVPRWNPRTCTPRQTRPIPRPRWPHATTGVMAMGQSVVVLGAQWGDEGKGKIVDLLTEEIG